MSSFIYYYYYYYYQVGRCLCSHLLRLLLLSLCDGDDGDNRFNHANHHRQRINTVGQKCTCFVVVVVVGGLEGASVLVEHDLMAMMTNNEHNEQ